MAATKSFTSVEQSRKLAEILPLESADMYYLAKPDDTNSNMVVSDICIPRKSEYDGQAFGELCAWSLAALLSALPNGIVMNKDSQNDRYHFSSKYIGTYVTADNPIDACYEMIIRLNELNLL